MRFSALDGKTIGVWGAGLETRSFARHVADKLPGARITVVVLEEPADAPELTDGARVVDAAGAWTRCVTATWSCARPACRSTARSWPGW